jgi:hypothetical protein
MTTLVVAVKDRLDSGPRNSQFLADLGGTMSKLVGTNNFASLLTIELRVGTSNSFARHHECFES